MNAQTIMICSGKGGTGKSTVSVLLGAQLGAWGRRVLLCRQARPEKFRLPGRFVAAFLSDRKGQCRRYNFSENRPSSTGRFALPAGSQ